MLTDLEKPSLEITTENIELNGVQSNTKVEAYRWGDPFEEQYDIVIGTDIIYSLEGALALVKAIAILLKENGQCILANDDIRSLNYHDAFFKSLEEN